LSGRTSALSLRQTMNHFTQWVRGYRHGDG